MSPAPATQVAKHRSKRSVPSTHRAAATCASAVRASAWGRSRPLEQRHLPAALLPIAVLRASMAAVRYAPAARLHRLTFRDRPRSGHRASAPRAVFHLNADDRSSVCATPRRERPPSSRWHAVAPFRSDVDPRRVHRGSSRERFSTRVLCRCITSSSTWLTATAIGQVVLAREEVGGQPRGATSRRPRSRRSRAGLRRAHTRVRRSRRAQDHVSRSNALGSRHLRSRGERGVA